MLVDIGKIQSDYEAACAFARTAEAANLNAIWYAASGRLSVPTPRAMAAAAAEAIRCAYQEACGTLTVQAEVPKDVARTADAPFNAASFLEQLQAAHPPAALKARSRQLLLGSVGRALGLQSRHSDPPRATRQGWVFTLWGYTEVWCDRLQMSFQTAASLRATLPQLAELLATEGDDAAATVAEVREAISAWDNQGRPAGRYDFPQLLGWRITLFAKKVELRLGHAEAERLQLAMAELEEGRAAA